MLESKELAASVADFARPAQCGCRLTLARAVPGITRLDGEPREKSKATPEACEGRPVRHKECQNIFEDVRSRYG